MARQSEFVDYTLELLADLGPVGAKSMFGGYGLYLDGTMFGIIADEVIYIKADELNREAFTSEGLEPFRLESKNAVMSYYTVPESAMDDPTEMCRWGQLGVEAAVRAKISKKRPKKRTAKK